MIDTLAIMNPRILFPLFLNHRRHQIFCLPLLLRANAAAREHGICPNPYMSLGEFPIEIETQIS